MPQKIPKTLPDYDKARVIEKPDGFYWLDKELSVQYGPFTTLWEAVQDMEYSAEPEIEVDEDLHEVEEELGIADWVDPDTGELAEETFTHLEDH